MTKPTYIEMDTDLLLLAAEGNERKAKERLREMTPAEWRDLRQACSWLDEWIDDVIIERHQRTHERKVSR